MKNARLVSEERIAWAVIVGGQMPPDDVQPLPPTGPFDKGEMRFSAAAVTSTQLLCSNVPAGAGARLASWNARLFR